MSRNIEKKIRQNASLIYIIAAIACCLMVLYLYNLSNNIDNQKDRIEYSKGTLNLTNSLISYVNHAQSEAALYVTSGKTMYLKSFKRDINTIKFLSDSIGKRSRDTVQINLIGEINTLLDKKGNIIFNLNRQFGSTNPIDIISKSISNYKPVVRNDSLIVKREIRDTVINSNPNKKFFRRLSEAFNPKKYKDSLVTVRIQDTETLRVARVDTISIVSDIDIAARKASNEYLNHIKDIGSQINKLIAIEEEISSQISLVLLDLHKQTLDSIMSEIDNSEKIIRKNYIFSIIGNVLSLALILLFIFMIINDVNKGYAARRALEEANESIKKTMESRHKLLLSVSHDIKSPLSSILGYLDMAEGVNERQLSEIESMKNSGKYILSLLSNLLDFSSLERGSMKISKSVFYLNHLVSETAKMFEPISVGKGLYLNVEMNFPKDLNVVSDPLKIKQIVANILSNGIKYTQNGGVTLVAKYGNGVLQIIVSDTGVGIPEDKLDEIFTPFYRVETNSSMAEGSGFGMYVVKGLVDLLGGEISISSEVGKGSVVSVTIPVSESSEVCNAKVEGLGVLVVDDYKPLLNILSGMLEKMGHKVIISLPNKKDLIEHLKSSPDIDIVLTDMDMGRFSGSEVLSAVREFRGNIPVVIMTASDSYSEADAENVGFDRFLRKPFSAESLQECINLVIKREGGEAKAYAPTSLSDMFDGDSDAIKEVMELFIDSTEENLSLLENALLNGDLKVFQELSHKMLPMFTQLQIDEVIPYLNKFNSSRKLPSDQYLDWYKDARGLISSINRWLYSTNVY